jgi:hypothetical protein
MLSDRGLFDHESCLWCVSNSSVQPLIGHVTGLFRAECRVNADNRQILLTGNQLEQESETAYRALKTI